MTKFESTEHPHRRYNPLTQSWVLCSPHRTKRPWQGQTDTPSINTLPKYDPKCYLCPGNERAGGKTNEKYDGVWVFENDYAALLPEEVEYAQTFPGMEGILTPEILPDQSKDETDGSPDPSKLADPLFLAHPTRGRCYVICFSPRHDLTIAQMHVDEIQKIIQGWTDLYQKASKENPWIKYIQIFENKGAAMGCSNPHPHGQAWTLSYIPTLPQTILKSLRDFALNKTNQQNYPKDVPKLQNGLPSLLLLYAHRELSLHTQQSSQTSQSASPPQSRVIHQSTHFISLIPFWATWPYEILILPIRRHVRHLADLGEEEKEDLAKVLKKTEVRMDNLFQTSFPYSMGIYQSPVIPPDSTSQQEPWWSEFAQFHVGFYPPLLRSESVKKFLVGFELFAEAQRDITPEQAAARLRDRDGEVHYKKKVLANVEGSGGA